MKGKRYILFDLDGTLTESGEGIINSVIYALKKKGITVEDRSMLLPFVGPPLVDSLERYFNMSREDAMASVEDYREYFNERGWKENRVYDGIPEALAKLKGAGKYLIVATSKPEVFAKRILEYFELAQYFDLIVGSTLDGSVNTKGQVIALALERMKELNHGEEVSKEDIVMVGDREYDVNGAKENGLPCLGVLYGYGNEAELRAAGAKELCPEVKCLPEILL